MNLQFENLETKRLLAADLEVIHPPTDLGVPGEEVTRLIRVYSEEAAEVDVRSLVTNELDNASWRRFDTYGKQLAPVLGTHTDVFAFSRVTSGQQIGDFNGDGVDDVLFRRTNSESVVVFGGASSGFDLATLSSLAECGPECDSIGPRLNAPLATRPAGSFGPFPEFRPAGDVNGDGFDDLAYVRVVGQEPYSLSIVYGSADLGWDAVIDVTDAPGEYTSVIRGVSDLDFIGDVNADGRDDMVIGKWATGAAWLPNFQTDEPLLLFGSSVIEPNSETSVESLVAAGLTADFLESVRRPSPLADFNGDGIGDFVVEGAEDRTPVVYLGSPTGEFDSIKLFSIQSKSRQLGQSAFDGAGDFNGDGFTDLLFSFLGNDCDCGASGRPQVSSGVVVVYGSPTPGSTLPTEIIVDRESPFAPYGMAGAADMLDTDGDGFADVRLGQAIIRGSANPQDVDFGHERDGSSGFDGDTIYGFRDAIDVFDINGDGVTDYLSREGMVALGRPRIPVGSGGGDIRDTVTMRANSSVTYEVVGTLKANAVPISSTAVTSDETASLANNIVSDQAGVLVGVEIDSVSVDGNLATARIVATNRGPNIAIGVELTESLTNSWTNVTWEQSSRLFPSEIHVDELSPGVGTAFVGPETSLFFMIEVDPTRAQMERYFGGPFYTSLGGQIGTLGDVNNDGRDDVFVSWKEDSRQAPWQRLEFFGSADFTENGFSMPGEQTNPVVRLGATDAVFGDLNGDGIDDTIRVQRRDFPDFVEQPEVNVVFGGPDGTPDVPPKSLDGNNGFRVIFPFSPFDVQPTVLSDFDVNGDGIDDLLIGDPYSGASRNFGGTPMHGAAFLILGRSATDASGQGPLDQAIDLPVGAEVVINLLGTVEPGQVIQGRADIVVAADQLDLKSNAKSASYNQPEPLTGDLDASGVVDFADFLILSSNFGQSPKTAEEGDLDGDSVVGFADFLILSANFGRSA